MSKELPQGRWCLKHLSRYADRLQAVLVPARQQVTYAAAYADDLLEGDHSEAACSAVVVGELRRRVARGFPQHELLTGYLGDGRVAHSQVPDGELRRLEGLIRSGAATADDRQRHLALSVRRIGEYRAAINDFTGRVVDLHRRVVERLAAPPAQPSAPDAPPGAAEGPGAGAEAGGCGSAQAEVTKPAGGKIRPAVSGVQPSSAADQWA